MAPELEAHLKALMVDPATVTLPDTLALARVQQGALPEANGQQLRPATLRYETTVQVQGQNFTIGSTRTIQATQLEGRPVWMVADHVRMPMAETRDTSWVDRHTLRPLRRAVHGVGSLVINYTANQITGRMQSPMGSMAIDKALDAPVVGDGGAFDLYIAGLPLKEGFEAGLRVFNPQQQEVRPVKLRVTGTQTIETPAGTFEVYVIRLEMLDGSPGGGTLYVRREAPHYSVLTEQQLPAQMGGGMAVTRLIALELQ